MKQLSFASVDKSYFTLCGGVEVEPIMQRTSDTLPTLVLLIPLTRDCHTNIRTLNRIWPSSQTHRFYCEQVKIPEPHLNSLYVKVIATHI